MSRCLSLIAAVLLMTASLQAAEPPKVGDEAKDFELARLDGQKTKLSALTESGPVVLLVLRGYPGYQCPICTKQVAEFLGAADQFKSAKSKVLLVYPGPAADLDKHAKEFVTGKEFPSHFVFVTDPGYQFVNAYGLRWDAPKETAYPSTFVIDSKRIVRFATISKSHGGRAKAADVLKSLNK